MITDASEARVTLRLPTVVEIEIAPMAIVRWLRANGWHEINSQREGVAMFDRRGGRDGLTFATDPQWRDIERRAIDAIQYLAALDRVAPHIMAARIMAADAPVALVDPFATIKARIEAHAYVIANGEVLFKAELFAAYGLTNHPTIELLYEFAHARGQRRGDAGVLESFAEMLPILAGTVTP